MRRTILICILLCNASTLVLSRKAVQWRRHQNNSATIAIGNDLYTVSKVDRATLNFRTSKDAKIDCTVRNDPYLHFIDGRLRAAALKDNETVVVWGEQRTEDPSKRQYLIQLIDPWKCYTKQLVIVEDEDVSSDAGEREAQVVTFVTEFDFYLPSRKKCSPCRFDDRGKNVYLQRQVQSEGDVDKFLIEPISPGASWSSFVYVNNFGNGKAVVRVLGNDFGVLREQYVDHSIDVVSSNHYIEPLVTVCYSKPTRENQRTIRCDGFDINLQSQWSVRPRLPVELSNARVVLAVDPHRNSHVGVAYYDVNNQMLQRRYIRYDRVGKVVDKIVFAGIAMKSDPKYWELFGYLLERKYCMAVFVREEGDKFEGDEIVECVELVDLDFFNDDQNK